MGLEVAHHGDVLVATIDRPERRNAVDLAIYHQLEDAVCSDVSAVVITGAGGDFSAGDDVRMFDFADRAAGERFLVDVTRIFRLVEEVPRPVVAAVDGYALGFGFELALVADACVATPGAVFGLPEITHGAAPPNALGRGVDVLGRGWVRHLALTGRHWLSGTEAHARGLVVELHDRDDLVGAAVELATDMATVPSFGAVKRLLSRDAERTYRLVPDLMAPLMASPTVASSQGRYADRG